MGIILQPKSLLIVGRKVFDRCTHALRLNTANHSSSAFATQQRVLGVVFEVTAAERIPMDIHARTEDNVASIF